MCQQTTADGPYSRACTTAQTNEHRNEGMLCCRVTGSFRFKELAYKRGFQSVLRTAGLLAAVPGEALQAW